MGVLTRTAATFRPPVMEARRWLEGVDFPPARPLINVSQAAPVDPPPEAMRQVMAEIALTRDDAHLYGPVLGLESLRKTLAARTGEIYGGAVHSGQVGITSGCNQAFSAAIATLCDEGDEVILPVPWYFNHKMWLDMAGAVAVPLSTSEDVLPDVLAAAAAITARTRAIALVSPNNPGGVEYPADLLQRFFNLARANGIALILDETYRDFHATDGAPHGLFSDQTWEDTLIHLYSFSKAYRLTGHRVGAIVTSPQRLSEVEKFLDTVAICPAQIGQHAALWGMENLGDWLAAERREILHRRAAIEAGFPRLAAKGWGLLGCGAYFAYMRHPLSESAATLAPRMVRDCSVLCLPGTMFRPEEDDRGAQELRIAYANLDVIGIGTLFDRLETLQP
ncbi:MAG: aminotransferase [Pseudomonadota bacterium]